MLSNMDELRPTFSPPFLLLITFSLTIYPIYAANNTINIGETIRDGDTLVSSGGIFELGFFTPGNQSSNGRYLAIWYTKRSFIVAVWIANRQTPLKNRAGVLTVTESGVLVLLDGSGGGVVWSSNSTASNPVAQLLDSGNLVVKDATDHNYAWQSFDHPTDTYLPGMKLGRNFAKGFETYLSSWRSDDDPSPGECTLRLDSGGFPQVVVRKGEDVKYRVVASNGVDGSLGKLTLEVNEIEISYREDANNRSALWRSRLSQTGVSQRFMWDDSVADWILYRSTPSPGDACDAYNLCGEYGVCDDGSSPVCGCLVGFVSKNVTKGCIRRIPLENCSRKDVFLKYSGVKLPDSRHSFFSNRSVGVEECREECLRNCSCMAYVELDVGSGVGRGCLLYYEDLIDIKNISLVGNDLYIRMDSSESENAAGESKGNGRVILIASLTSGVGVFLLVLGLIILCIRKRKNDPKEDSELPIFKLSKILKATGNFSIDNMLGEGGFGAVYRGMLDDGEEVAVKRLSKSSTQGVEELKNEVILVAKLQHRNLVRLLGCCVEGDENMLIYEYMPNKSLNLILFDQTKSMVLDWRKRFNIINGIAKGLLYLHQDSRLRIIHRDLKASNILLDSEMNPRISDFGIARSFGGNETQARTHKVVGTYGYMSPEYSAHGLFSVKSDVFSFGVLVLEVVSGKRNREFALGNSCLNLLGHVWKLDKEENPLAIVDAILGDEFDSSQVLRSIRVALLCVQKFPEDRPNMSSVVFMLGNEVAVPQAKEPGFFLERDVLVAHSSTITKPTISQNEITITFPEGR